MSLGEGLEKTLGFLEQRALDRMEVAHNNGGRSSTERANEAALQSFLSRPIGIRDSREWYRQHYAEAGLEWSGPDPAKKQTIPSIQDRAKLYQSYIQTSIARAAHSQSMGRSL